MEKRVLLVDDNVELISPFVSLLEKSGCIVHIETRLAGAISYINKNLPVDLIVLDMIMDIPYEFLDSKESKDINRDFIGYWFYHNYLERLEVPVVILTEYNEKRLLTERFKWGNNFAGIINKWEYEYGLDCIKGILRMDCL